MKSDQTRNRNYKIFIVLSILLILASISFFDYVKMSSQQSNESVHDMAKKVNDNISLTIYNKINDIEMILNAHALQAAQYTNIKDETIMNVLHAQSVNDNFLDLSIAGMDGVKTYARTYEESDCTNEIDFQTVVQGKRYVSKDIQLDINGKRSIRISVPIERNGSVIGMLQSTVDLEMFREILKLSCTEEGQNAILIEEDGTILSKTGGDIKETNLLTHFSNITIKDDSSTKPLKDSFSSKEFGNIHFEDEHGEFLAYYSTVKGDHDWIIVTMFPYDLISTQVTAGYKQTSQFSIKLVALLLIALVIILYLERKATMEMKNINKQLDTVIDNTTGCLITYEYHNPNNIRFLNDEFFNISGYSNDEFKQLFKNDYSSIIHPDDKHTLQNRLYNDLEEKPFQRSLSYSYRIIHKNGSYVWVMDRRRLLKDTFGKLWFYVTLMDITELKTIQEKLRVSQKRYEMIIEQTESVVFEWDVQNDTITLSQLWKQKYGYENEYHDFLTVVCRTFEKDEDSFIPLLERFIRGDMHGQIECKLRKANGEYIWCKVSARAIKDSYGYLVSVFGSIEDIHLQKSKTLILEEKSRIDGLTKVLNKITVQDQIIDTIKEYPNKRHVLFVIDADDFKQVNDTLGHAAGDKVLSLIGSNIMSCFRGDDFVGRIGGDEFVAFMKNIHEDDIRFVRNKIDTLHHALSSIEIEDGKAHKVTCSIGVAIYPDDGTTFEELFISADKALYSAKKNGKDSCCLIGDEKENET